MTQTARDIDSLETLRILYPVFKEEVYRRRAVIAQIARQGSLFFVSLSLLTALFFSEGRTLSLLFKGLACAAVSFATILLIIQIRQEKLRHEKAKQQLITLEKGFQFFEAGSYLPNEPLYPPEWQKRPRIDPGMMISLAGLIGTSLLLILTILII
jgi:hypothetical protein